MKNIYFYLALTSLVAFLVTGCADEKVEPKKTRSSSASY